MLKIFIFWMKWLLKYISYFCAVWMAFVNLDIHLTFCWHFDTSVYIFYDTLFIVHDIISMNILQIKGVMIKMKTLMLLSVRQLIAHQVQCHLQKSWDIFFFFISSYHKWVLISTHDYLFSVLQQSYKMEWEKYFQIGFS